MRRLFAVSDMACGGCALGLERRLSKVDGINSVGVHYLTASMLVDWNEARLSVPQIADLVATAGYRLIERHRPEELSILLTEDIRRLGTRLAVAVMAGMWSMALSIVLYVSKIDPAVAWWIASASGLLAVPVVFWAGRGIFWMALRSIILKTTGLDLLVAVGAGGAFAISTVSLATGSADVYFDTATMLVTLLLIGRLLDLVTRREAISALTALQAASPETALLARSDGVDEVVLSQIQIGDHVVINAGAGISVDGLVVTGTSAVDRSAMTGESAPVAVSAGERVTAGTVNLSRRVIVEVDRIQGDRDIDRMGGSIALEIARRGSITSRADRVAGILSWAIPALATITAIGLAFAGVAMGDAALRGLAIVAGACPCALSIAAPLAQTRAASFAAAHGIRLREPTAFESLARVRTAIFDKTGTLTQGRPVVTDVSPAPGATVEDVLAAAAAAETGIAHPLARAVIERHGSEVGTGGTRLARGAQAVDPEGRKITVTGTASNTGATRLIVERNETLLGTLDVADVPKPKVADVLTALRQRHIAVSIATGDSKGPALSVAEQIGLRADNVHYECTAEYKAEIISRSERTVMFVGDGINDAPALAAADCGISVAGAHSAAAETADVAIVRGGVEQILTVISLARRTVAISSQNIAFALIYNAAVVPFAAMGALSPVMAALAMLASSLSVTANSMRLAVPREKTSNSRTAY